MIIHLYSCKKCDMMHCDCRITFDDLTKVDGDLPDKCLFGDAAEWVRQPQKEVESPGKLKGGPLN